MESGSCKSSVIKTKVCNSKDKRPHVVSVVHKHVQILNKVSELEIVMQSKLIHVNVPSFKEHCHKN
jgi:predicted AAA+ superfamily ATPase